MVRRHLEDPITSFCTDRRGSQWCLRLSRKEGYMDDKFSDMWSCTAFPFAFRECRMTCGYCSASMQLTRLKVRLPPRHQHQTLRRQEFDPLAKVTWKRPEDSDYFVVLDHNYDDFI
ncbi:unnamed protein product [Caenorhabditis auriculariae]|uniref:Uncharacterized protein n=1 Tax=Caenorhabditis auriculariae TaxID=2777116 RepID=A0A8S1GV51_9PELO|nr:unnamed protein product [Caenorhabditis auriculariae]